MNAGPTMLENASHAQRAMQVMLHTKFADSRHRKSGFITHRTSTFDDRENLQFKNCEQFLKKYQTPKAYW